MFEQYSRIMKLQHTSLGFMKKDKPFPKVDDVLSPSVEDKNELRVDIQFIRQPMPARKP